ncbi:MAG TPA: FHA domain-containing protein [Anaerolineales bacterium]|nr:FHA domain-containing protein [Anaerolineales bacterium]
MAAVVVTITDGKGSNRDLELPGDIPIRGLAPSIAYAIQHPDLPDPDIPVRFVLKHQLSGEVLSPDRTLEAAGVVHGDQLLLMVKPISVKVVGGAGPPPFGGPGFISSESKTFPFRGKAVVVGRVDAAAGIVRTVLGVDLTDLDSAGAPSVSRRHARIFLQHGEWLLEDLRSTNGTAVNEQWLDAGERVALRDGDEVRFGDVTLVFVWDSQEARPADS